MTIDRRSLADEGDRLAARPGDQRPPARTILVPLALALLLAGCGRAPSMGLDKAVFVEVDALYSAISLNEPAQVERNAARLDQLRAAGRLPEAAHRALARIIAEAKADRWEPARQQLRDFMLDQRGGPRG